MAYKSCHFPRKSDKLPHLNSKIMELKKDGKRDGKSTHADIRGYICHTMVYCGQFWVPWEER